MQFPGHVDVRRRALSRLIRALRTCNFFIGEAHYLPWRRLQECRRGYGAAPICRAILPAARHPCLVNFSHRVPDIRPWSVDGAAPGARADRAVPMSHRRLRRMARFIFKVSARLAVVWRQCRFSGCRRSACRDMSGRPRRRARHPAHGSVFSPDRRCAGKRCLARYEAPGTGSSAADDRRIALPSITARHDAVRCPGALSCDVARLPCRRHMAESFIANDAMKRLAGTGKAVRSRLQQAGGMLPMLSPRTVQPPGVNF